MKVSVRQAGQSVPVKIHHNNVVLSPRLDQVVYGVKPKSVFKYSLDPYETFCNRCGSPHRLMNANRTKGFTLYWTCRECVYPLMTMLNGSYTILNEPVRWYVKLWWEVKLGLKGLRRLFDER